MKTIIIDLLKTSIDLTKHLNKHIISTNLSSI